MDEAVRLATEANAYGFFYQQHTNTYQIVGLYASQREMQGTRVAHGHARGAIGVLTSAITCLAPASYDENETYPGDSSDM